MIQALLASQGGTLTEKGARALQAEDLVAALSHFRAAEQAEPGRPDTQFDLGLTLLRLGRAKEAIPHLEKATKRPDLSNEAQYLLGRAYFELSEYDKAVAAIRDLTDGPWMDHVLYLREECNRLLGRMEEARNDFVQLNRKYPDSSWVHFLLGNAYENQSKPELALAEYKLSLARNTAQLNARFAVGYLYWVQQDFENSKTWLEKEIAFQPCHSLALFYRGEIARADQEWEAAEKYYRKALTCNPNAPEPHLSLGIVLAERKNNTAALDELKRACKLAPDQSGCHYRLALLYKKFGRERESAAEYQIVKEIQASHAQPNSLTAAKP